MLARAESCADGVLGAGLISQAVLLADKIGGVAWPRTLSHGGGRGTAVLSLCCKFTGTLRHTDKNRQREEARRRNLWSGITNI